MGIDNTSNKVVLPIGSVRKIDTVDKTLGSLSILFDTNELIYGDGYGIRYIGGTRNYEKLDFLPKINGKRVVGNLSLEDLGIGRAYDYIRKIEERFYEIGYSQLDYKSAYKYFESKYHHVPNGPLNSIKHKAACSAIYKNGLFGKNLDWLYNDCVEFFVMSNGGKYVNGGVVGGITEFNKKFMDDNVYDPKFKYLPFLLNNGFNEKGVFVGLNVVPTGDYLTPTTGTHPTSTDPAICTMMLPKYILDNYATAEAAVSDIEDKLNVYCPYGEEIKEEMHLMIGDANKVYIVEFINNETEVIDITLEAQKWFTNYYRKGAQFDSDNHLVISSLTPHASGVQRSNIIADNYNSINSIKDMMNAMQNLLRYTNAYSRETDPYWYDEFVGNYGGSIGNLTVTDAFNNPDKFTSVVNYAINEFENRSRDPESEHYNTTWQTTHSVVYDIFNKQAYVVVQEEGLEKTYSFGLSSIDSKLDKFQGFSNAGKCLIVNESGVVESTDVKYVHEQPLNTKNWVIEHNLNGLIKSIAVYVTDDEGVEHAISGGVYEIVNNNKGILHFNNSIKGRCIVSI